MDLLGRALERKLKERGFRVECKRVNIASSTYLCSENGFLFVAKVYDLLSTLKWLIVYPLSAPAIDYRISAYERLLSEIRYSIRMKTYIKTFKVIGVTSILNQYVLLREYIPGDSLTVRRDNEAWRMAGSILALIHSRGVALGDANPGNFVVSDSGIALVDLEQAREMKKGLAAWDIMTLIIHSYLSGVRESLLEEALRCYAENSELQARVRRELLDPRVWTPFMLVAQPVLPLAVKTLRRTGYM